MDFGFNIAFINNASLKGFFNSFLYAANHALAFGPSHSCRSKSMAKNRLARMYSSASNAFAAEKYVVGFLLALLASAFSSAIIVEVVALVPSESLDAILHNAFKHVNADWSLKKLSPLLLIFPAALALRNSPSEHLLKQLFMCCTNAVFATLLSTSPSLATAECANRTVKISNASSPSPP